jgi:homoserine kinase
LRTHKNERGVEIELPATSANLGPGFDAVALAMNLRLRIAARRSCAFKVTARGRDVGICGALRNNLVLSTYQELLAGSGRDAPALELTIRNEIPIGKGCGSSAAARIAGLLLANHFGRLQWSPERLLSKAAHLEGHADNAAACWFGGVVIARANSDTAEVTAVKLQLRSTAQWPLLLAIPEAPLSTEKARQALPDSYSRPDVVSNVQNAMLLVAAFQRGDRRLLGVAMDDRVHEPYRSSLCPLLSCLKPLAGCDGILGVALSGAGPSVLLFIDPDVSVSAVRRRVRARMNQDGLSAELLLTEIASAGPPRLTERKRQ